MNQPRPLSLRHVFLCLLDPLTPFNYLWVVAALLHLQRQSNLFLKGILMNIVAFLLVGLIAGWLAGKIVDGHGLGVIPDIAIGIVGAFIGGILSDRIIGEEYGFWGAVLISTLGAIILLILARLIGSGTTRPHAP